MRTRVFITFLAKDHAEIRPRKEKKMEEKKKEKKIGAGIQFTVQLNLF